ncbi:MAG: hypothetical protein KDD55_07735 [Bdellovibrionales bacterium]|nr:hypothetical protein [Bdellovibrionales bacterium]
MKTLLSLLLLVFLQACAPGLDRTLHVTQIPTSDHPSQFIQGRLTVGHFTDSRNNLFVGTFDGKNLMAEGDVPASVALAFERELKSRHAQLVAFDAPILEGEVRKWIVEIHTGFPVSRIKAEAKVRIRLLQHGQVPLFRGEYEGNVTYEHPLVSQSDIEKILTESMSFAIQEALEDSRFQEALTAGQAERT